MWDTMQTLAETRKGVVIVKADIISLSVQKRNQSRRTRRTNLKRDRTAKRSTTLTRVGNGSVLLQTARAYAVNGSTSIPVRILFDTGSQRSYVTNDVARRLRLTPVKRDTLNLSTFGTNKSKRQSCELYKVNIKKQRESR